MGRAPAQNYIDLSLFNVLARHLTLIGTMRYVRAEGSRCRISDLASTDESN